MHVRGALVVKLPAERVEALVRAGEGVHFDANKGTPMREWLSLDPGSGRPWLALATEALDFARSARGRFIPPARSQRPPLTPRLPSRLACSRPSAGSRREPGHEPRPHARLPGRSTSARSEPRSAPGATRGGRTAQSRATAVL